MEFENLILQALQTKFPGVDAKILGRIAKKAAKTATGTTEAEAKTVADGITFQQVLESHADYRATEASKTAVQNYEAKHKLQDGKPIQEPAQTTPPATPAKTAEQGAPGQPQEETPAWVQAVLDSNKKLQERLDGFEREKITNDRLAQFKKAIEPLSEKYRARYERDFGRLAFKDDEDFKKYLEEIAPDIKDIAEQEARTGAKVTSPLGGSGNNSNEASALVKARFESAAKAEPAPAIQGLPTITQ